MVSTNETRFTTKDNFTLFEKSLTLDNAKGVVLITHGIAEHSGRHEHVAQALNSAGFSVVLFDLRGHGKSSGKRCYINSFQEYLDDFEDVLLRTKETFSDLPLFLFGHSMGGGIIAQYCIERQAEVTGLLLSAPSVKVSDEISPLLQKISGILSTLVPKLPVLKLESADISKDPRVVEAYDSDPLNFRGSIFARTGAELLNSTKLITAQAATISLPLIVMHGTEDKIADVSGSKMLYENVSSTDKTLKLYDGLFHEIFNEPEQDQVIADMISWLDSHL